MSCNVASRMTLKSSEVKNFTWRIGTMLESVLVFCAFCHCALPHFIRPMLRLHKMVPKIFPHFPPLHFPPFFLIVPSFSPFFPISGFRFPVSAGGPLLPLLALAASGFRFPVSGKAVSGSLLKQKQKQKQKKQQKQKQKQKTTKAEAKAEAEAEAEAETEAEQASRTWQAFHKSTPSSACSVRGTSLHLEML